MERGGGVPYLQVPFVSTLTVHKLSILLYTTLLAVLKVPTLNFQRFPSSEQTFSRLPNNTQVYNW